MVDVSRRWDGPGLEAWRAAWTPWDAARHLEGIGIPWCVVGGWAVDLFLGRQSRPHDDLEIAIVESDLPAIRTHFSQYALYAVGDGEVLRLPPLAPMPADKHQVWVLDQIAGLWRVDVMQEPGDQRTWVYRRDTAIAASRDRMIDVRDGIPFLRPEGAILYKAKSRRPKDEADFASCLPRGRGCASLSNVRILPTRGLKPWIKIRFAAWSQRPLPGAFPPPCPPGQRGVLRSHG